MSVKYNCISDIKNFKKYYSNFNAKQTTHLKLKKLAKENIFKKY